MFTFAFSHEIMYVQDHRNLIISVYRLQQRYHYIRRMKTPNAYVYRGVLRRVSGALLCRSILMLAVRRPLNVSLWWSIVRRVVSHGDMCMHVVSTL